jgi:CO/xanthine dehydrogenase Mo-binding subunit
MSRFVEPVVVVAETSRRCADAAAAPTCGTTSAGRHDLRPRAGTSCHTPPREQHRAEIGPLGDEVTRLEGDVTVRLRQRNQRVAIAPIEGRAVLAAWEDDRLTVWVSGQGPHPHRDVIAPAFGLEPERVRVVCPDVGGGFGAKAYAYPEEAVMRWLGHGRPAVRRDAQRADGVPVMAARLQDIAPTGQRRHVARGHAPWCRTWGISDARVLCPT